MKIIGLTGSVGMGKSVAASLLRRLRIPVHDSDAAIHEMLSPTGEAFTLVARMFPSAWDMKKRIIDRRKLGEIVFNDPEARRKLEAVLHPFVWARQRKFVLKARRMGVKRVVLDIPLLYETGSERKCDAVMVVTAPYLLQRQRVLRRANMTEQKFHAILALQVPDIEKRRRADYVIHSGLGRAFSLQQIKAFLRSLR